MNTKKVVNISVLVIISATFLYLATRNTNLNVMINRIHEINVVFLLLSLFVLMVGYIVRGIRWKVYFLMMGETVLFWHALKVLVMGFAANNVLPLRAGEIYRAYAIHKLYSHISIPKIFTTVVVERTFDGISVIVFALVGSMVLPMPAWATQAMWVGSVVFGVLFVLFILSARYTPKAQRLVDYVSQVAPGRVGNAIRHFFSQLFEGLMALQSFTSLFYLMGLSVVVWGLEVLFYYLSFYAFGIELSLGFAAFLMGIINLAIVIPSSPGGVGAYEYVTVLTFSLMGVNESLSFLFAIVTHSVANISVIIFGLLFWYSLKKNMVHSNTIL